MSHPADLIHTERIVELTKTLVSIPSVTGNEQAMSDWVLNFFDELGLDNIRRLPVEDAGDTVVATYGSGSPAMFLHFHMDTFAAFDDWQTDPFTPHIDGDRLYGLGAHDMKGGAACVLAAVEAMVKSGIELGGQLVVAGTTDEEDWSRGAHELVNSGALDDCLYCLMPEPSDKGTLTVGARGRHVFQLTFHGKTVHAAYEGGVNALTDAARIAAYLGDPDAVELGYDAEFDLTGSLCVIGLHSGGTMILVPESAELYIDRHILPGQTVEEAAEQLREIIAEVGIEGSYELSWDNRPTPAPLPCVVPPDSHFVQTVSKHLAREQKWDAVEYVLARSVSDLNHIAIAGNTPTLILGPQGGNTCTANEYVSIGSLAPVARTYVHSVLDLLGK
ncbi:MAG: M20 family metallopeptidase [Candidatus Promineifilaceae bacterium]